MPSTEKLDTHRKALTVNLDGSTFGCFADDANHSAPIREDEPAVGEVCGA